MVGCDRPRLVFSPLCHPSAGFVVRSPTSDEVATLRWREGSVNPRTVDISGKRRCFAVD